MLVYFMGRSHLFDMSLIHDDNFIGKAHGFRLVVGDIHAGNADPLLNFSYLFAHVHPEFRIQVG